jgi:hypothetical protein
MLSAWIVIRRDGCSHKVLSSSGALAERGRSTRLSASVSRRALAAMLAVAASSLAPPALAATTFLPVHNASSLQDAINDAVAGDTIVFSTNITLSSNLPQLNKSITIDGNNFTLSGANLYRGF